MGAADTSGGFVVEEMTMRIASRQAATVAAFFLAMTVIPPVRAAPTFTWTVDCSRGQSISQALEHALPARKLMLIVRGTCTESVLIDRDDVVLQGDSKVGGTVNGPDATVDTILIRGSRITISGLTITGGQNGITAWGANNVSIAQSLIQGAAKDGIKVVGSPSVWLEWSRIERNGGAGINLERAASLMFANTVITGNGGAGLHVGEKSNVSGWDNTISYNGSNGVDIFDGSNASLWGNTITDNGTNGANTVNFRNGVAAWFSTVNIGGNRITNNPSSGVRATVSTLNIGDSTISGNGEGVMLYLASQLIMHAGNNVVTNNRGIGVLLSTNSTGTVSGARIEFNAGDGFAVQQGSMLIFFVEAPTISGGNGGFGLRCADAESSVVDLQRLIVSSPNGQGNVSPTCTGF